MSRGLPRSGALPLLPAEEHLFNMSDWNLCAVVWALGKLKVKPGSAFTRKVAAEFQRRGIGQETVAMGDLGVDEFIKRFSEVSQSQVPKDVSP